MNYNDRMSYVQRQERIEQQRRREAAAASNAKSNRTQVMRAPDGGQCPLFVVKIRPP
jgi:hypothetical protein